MRSRIAEGARALGVVLLLGKAYGYALSLVFMMGTLGIGIFISTASRPVPQAVQLTFVTFQVTFQPSIGLSGLLFPIEGMPMRAEYLVAFIPLTYFLRIVRGIILKGVGVRYLWPSLLPW